MANRQTRCRSVEITVTYLMKALGRCRRTIQNYLRELERAGYIGCFVIAAERSRMAIGLVIVLLEAIMPRHGWPKRKNGGFPGAQEDSQKHLQEDNRLIIPVRMWALRCMEGVFRSLMVTIPPFPAIAEGQAGAANG